MELIDTGGESYSKFLWKNSKTFTIVAEWMKNGGDKNSF